MNLFDASLQTSPDLVQQASEAYEAGQPILTDQEFDLLAETGLDQDSRNFRTKVTHAVVMGSLSKKRTVDELSRFLDANPCRLLIVMPKVDGLSVGISAAEQRIQRVASRGNGLEGNDITSNALKTKVLKTLPETFRGQVELRAEAVISKAYSGLYDTNLRNVAAGMLGAKDSRDGLADMDMLVFDVYGPRYQTWSQKRDALSDLPRGHVVPFVELPVSGLQPAEMFCILKEHYETWLNTFPYAIDGIVITAIKHEDESLPVPILKPTHKVALKFGSTSYPATVGRIEFSLGKYGKLAPVLILADPVEIDATQVQRVSASNWSLLKSAGLGVGAKIQVQKSGDVIPWCSSVDEPSQQGLESLPDCPSCGQKAGLSPSGVDAVCINEDCAGREFVKMKSVIDVFAIDFISDATLQSLFDAGFDTLEKLFAATPEEIEVLPGFGEKSSRYIVEALSRVELSEPLVIKAAGLRGIGERKAGMLLDFYGCIENLIEGVTTRGLANIANFGPEQTALIEARIDDIAETVDRLKRLGVTIKPYQSAAPAAGEVVVCCTGACPGLTRAQLEQKLSEKGFRMVDSMTSDVVTLVAADPNGSSSKLKKARAKGIPVVSYDEFLAGL